LRRGDSLKNHEKYIYGLDAFRTIAATMTWGLWGLAPQVRAIIKPIQIKQGT